MDARLGDIRDTMPVLTNAVKNFGAGFSSVMQAVVRDILVATARLLFLKGLVAVINVVSPGSGTAFGGALGLAGGGNLGPAGGASAGLTVRTGTASLSTSRGMIEIPVEVVRAAGIAAGERQARLGAGA